MLTFEQIKELIDLVSERDLQGVEIERSGFRVKIDGRTAVVGTVSIEGSENHAGAEKKPTTATAKTADGVPVGSTDDSTTEEAAALDGLHMVQSPIVGTFYTSPSPDSDPYVRAGDRVKKGQVLCIVEAMKLMNEIESDADGVVEKVFPSNAQPVEFGEPLFAIRAD